MIELCSRCKCPVSQFDRKYALGRIWHPHCFTCSRCNKYLNDCSVALHNGLLLCRDCYSYHELPPPCIRPTVSKKTEVCSCNSICSKNGKNCVRCSSFKPLRENTSTRINLSSNIGNKNTPTSNINTSKYCPSTTSSVNKATSTCSMSNINKSSILPNIFKLTNNRPYKSTSEKKSAPYRTSTPCELKKKPSPCSTQFLYTNKQNPQFLNTQKCSPKLCRLKNSQSDVNQKLSSSDIPCNPNSTTKCFKDKSSFKWCPKISSSTNSSSLKNQQTNKFVVLALPILGEMEM